MTDYEKDLDAAFSEGVKVKETVLKSDAAALIVGNKIALNTNILTTANEKACALAEEMGHFHTSVGNILDQSKSDNRKQELRARLWGYNNKVGLKGLIKAYENKCRTTEEAADFLGVTEEYLANAIECYREKYGVYTQAGNYIIWFIPSIAIGKLFD